MNEYKPPHYITGKQIAIAIGSLAGCMTMLSIIHSSLVVPAILREASLDIDKSVALHEARPHSNAASRADLTLILSRMDALPTKNDIEYLKERIAELSGRMKALEAGQK